MKISEILKNKKPSVSFEVFPPKKDAAFAPVKEAVHDLCALHPSFMSVTYGAGGSACLNTLEIANFIKDECSTTPLAHLTCIMATREKIATEATKLKASRIDNILALRGDIPAGKTMADMPGHFKYAVELISYLKSNFDFCIGGACYPERHPECPHLVDDIAHLKAKVDAGLDFVTTQMFFDNDIYFRYTARLRENGIVIPVIAGIMPVTNAKQVARICQLSGAHVPMRFKAIADRFGDRPDQMLEAGIAYATDQIIDLIANGVNAIHVYTMNNPYVGKRIIQNLGSIIE